MRLSSKEPRLRREPWLASSSPSKNPPIGGLFGLWRLVSQVLFPPLSGVGDHLSRPSIFGTREGILSIRLWRKVSQSEVAAGRIARFTPPVDIISPEDSSLLLSHPVSSGHVSDAFRYRTTSPYGSRLTPRTLPSAAWTFLSGVTPDRSPFLQSAYIISKLCYFLNPKTESMWGEKNLNFREKSGRMN